MPVQLMAARIVTGVEGGMLGRFAKGVMTGASIGGDGDDTGAGDGEGGGTASLICGFLFGVGLKYGDALESIWRKTRRLLCVVWILGDTVSKSSDSCDAVGVAMVSSSAALLTSSSDSLLDSKSSRGCFEGGGSESSSWSDRFNELCPAEVGGAVNVDALSSRTNPPASSSGVPVTLDSALDITSQA